MLKITPLRLSFQHALFALLTLGASAAGFAESIYGPVQDPWANCTDTLLDNANSGLLGVSCAIMAPAGGSITPSVIESAKAICLKQPKGAFGTVNGRHICLHSGQVKVGKPQLGINQFTTKEWSSFKWIAGRATTAGGCPPMRCSESELTRERSKQSFQK